MVEDEGRLGAREKEGEKERATECATEWVTELATEKSNELANELVEKLVEERVESYQGCPHGGYRFCLGRLDGVAGFIVGRGAGEYSR